MEKINDAEFTVESYKMDHWNESTWALFGYNKG